MPELKKMKTSFYDYEWKKHGDCYLKLLNDAVNGQNSPITDEFALKVVEKYFRSIITLYKRLTSKFKLIGNRYDDSDDLAKSLNIPPKSLGLNVVS